RHLSNVFIGTRSNNFHSFLIEGYTFHSTIPQSRSAVSIYTPQMASRENRNIIRSAFVLHSGAQSDAIINSGRRFYYRADRYKKAKQIHDLLVIGSILTSCNWALSSRRWEDNDFPITPSNHL